MSGSKKDWIIVPEFTMIEDNKREFAKINIVGKKIAEIRVENGSMEGECLESGGYHYICFEDGDILTLSGFDETLFLSYNAIRDIDGFKADTADCVLTGEFAEKTFGRTVVRSTLCGKPYEGIPMGILEELLHVPTVTIELDNGVIIGFAIECDTLYMGLGR